jgi:hypothetical protein
MSSALKKQTRRGPSHTSIRIIQHRLLQMRLQRHPLHATPPMSSALKKQTRRGPSHTSIRIIQHRLLQMRLQQGSTSRHPCPLHSKHKTGIIQHRLLQMRLQQGSTSRHPCPLHSKNKPGEALHIPASGSYSIDFCKCAFNGIHFTLYSLPYEHSLLVRTSCDGIPSSKSFMSSRIRLPNWVLFSIL